MSELAESREAELAGFVADLDPSALPTAVRDRAGLIIADTVGAMVGGASDPAVAALTADWATVGTDATLFGTPGRQTTPQRAAFLNGTAGTVLELDEGHRFAAGHPAIHVLPALFAEAERGYGSGEKFLTSFVAGYETAVRTARATRPLADGYHPHGVWGAVGGAAAVAHHREFDREQIRTALTIAANYAQHTRFEAASEGATVRNSYAGMSNLSALIAADQASAGFTGLEDGIVRHLQAATVDGVDADALVADLGRTWEVERGYFKRHAACRYTHPVLDAVRELQSTHDLDPAAVSNVTVTTYQAAAALDETAPTNALQAKFSIPFAVATALLSDGTGKEAFTTDVIDDKRLALADRVSVAAAEPFVSRAPAARGARVAIELQDGESIVREVRAARGGEHDPFTETELREKFTDLVVPVVGDGRATQLWEAARQPEAPRVICALTHA